MSSGRGPGLSIMTTTPAPGDVLPATPRPAGLSWRETAAAAVGSAGAYHLAFVFPPLAPLVVVHLVLLLALHDQPTARRAFWTGTAVGLLVCAPPMGFLVRVFGLAAPVLWLLIALWHGMFLLLVRGVARSGGTGRALALAAVLWTGLEYFRSEVWPLRFAWFTTGEAVSEWTGLMRRAGVYGAGLVLMATAATLLGIAVPAWRRRHPARALLAAAVPIALVALLSLPVSPRPDIPTRHLRVAGLQLEFPGIPEVLDGLATLRARNPDVELVVLPEYVLEGPVPPAIREWCRRNGVWMVAGGRDPVPAGGGAATNDAAFHNTAFVVGPDGEVVFRQAKAQPIQFFNDGLPAPGQAPWISPWGPLGVAVCYDLSYRRVMDRLVRAGAHGLVVPAMDVVDWGEWQHRLNARMTRVRAAEYGLPVIRIASSGISQIVGPDGREAVTAPFPGPGEILSGTLVLAGPGTVPPDAWLAPVALAASGAVAVALLARVVRDRFARRRRPEAP